ncbi:uncharacterized protein B0I36DRAFT_352635 [Microdochium trichocladiopsis]|uniref:Uncharacterized protein n=1 Tax=Microdochium trichocladiopsis TaxID=1682393 RepID=A0A9P8XXI5_9PEZI|nr:uncharacterized protein B0I36DRAFT_352635 [Microdochium trichocladiopsis]KAH7024394.1 hypothetical protein B0I36DRAFT_352635 [Microdochium trichocladiopsis]
MFGEGEVAKSGTRGRKVELKNKDTAGQNEPRCRRIQWAFLSIASRPYLTQSIEVLQWVMFPDQETVLRRWMGGPLRGYSRKARVMSQVFLDDCWLPLRDWPRECTRAWDAFCPELSAALSAMPHLQTLELREYRSLPGYHPIKGHGAISYKDGPKIGSLDWNDKTSLTEPYKFLAQAIENRNNNMEESDWVGNAVVSWTRFDVSDKVASVTYFRPVPIADLQHIRNVDICLPRSGTDCVRTLATILSSLQCLESLTVRYKPDPGCRIPPASDSNPELATAFFDSLVCGDARWPRLCMLSLIRLKIPAAVMASFLALHAPGLQQVEFRDCKLTTAHIEAIASIQLPKLSWFTAFTPEAKEDISPAEFTDYLKNNQGNLASGSSSRVGTHLESQPGDAFVSVFEPVDEQDRSIPHGTWSLPSLTGGYIFDVTPRMSTFGSGAESFKALWRWARSNPSRDIYYWQADPGDAQAEPTYTWSCSRGSTAERVVCRDPHEIWDDWGKIPGDVATPTPFGPDFARLVHGTEPWGNAEAPGDEIPPYATKLTKRAIRDFKKHARWIDPAREQFWLELLR